MAQGDLRRPSRGHDLEARKEVVDGLVEGEPSFLDELHDEQGGEELGDRGDRERELRVDQEARGHVGVADPARADHLALGDDRVGKPGQRERVSRGREQVIEIGFPHRQGGDRRRGARGCLCGIAQSPGPAVGAAHVPVSARRT
jgi:hypothetical protein